jgi:hypothetical protein
MTHHEKVKQFLADMERHHREAYATAPPFQRWLQGPKGNPHTYAPPVFRLLWYLGSELPPPHFLNFGALVLVMGLPFGLLWGGFMWLILFKGALSGWALLLASIGIGLLFGSAMAAYYRATATKLKLPKWEDYSAAESGLQISQRKASGKKRKKRSSH